MVFRTNVVERQYTKYVEKFIDLVELEVPNEFITFLVLKYPWRIPELRAYEASTGAAVNSSATPNIQVVMKDRLNSNDVYHVVVQVRYLNYQLSMYVFINGKLSGQTSLVTLLNHFQDKDMPYKLSSNFSDGNLLSVSYWPRLLGYREIQRLYLHAMERKGSELLKKGRETDSPTAQPTLSWLSGGRWSSRSSAQATVGKDGDTVCQSSTGQCDVPSQQSLRATPNDSTSIYLWPMWYSQQALDSTLPIWAKDFHLGEALCGIIDTLPPAATTSEPQRAAPGGSDIEIILLLRSSEAQVLWALLRDIVWEYPNLVIRMREINEVDKSLQSSAVDSYADTVNDAVAQSSNPVVVLLSSHIMPVSGWLAELTQALHGGAGIAGGVLLGAQGILLHAGFELLELPHAGGLEVYLTPHDRYRYV